MRRCFFNGLTPGVSIAPTPVSGWLPGRELPRFGFRHKPRSAMRGFFVNIWLPEAD